MIKRNYYLNRLIDYKDKDIIKIITGVKNSGKSYLLFNIYYDYLLSVGIKEENIIRINLESIRYKNLREPEKLFQYLDNLIKKG